MSVQKQKLDLSQLTCTVVRSHEPYQSKQGLTYFKGISADNSGAKAICMNLLTIPPGGRGRPHYHAGHETAIFVLSGEALTWYGEGLRQCATVRAGDFLYIPAGMPHLPVNLNENEPCTAIVARTDPNEQESVVLLD
jgi:uncharacterized RmlC-like cupin family protein